MGGLLKALLAFAAGAVAGGYVVKTAMDAGELDDFETDDGYDDDIDLKDEPEVVEEKPKKRNTAKKKPIQK